MKYRKLPIERELEALAGQKPEDMVKLRTGLFLETARTRGFQLFTAVLRNLDRAALAALRGGVHPRPERLIGRIEAIEEIRRTLTALLPDEQQPQVDWHDEEFEDYVGLDPSGKDE